MKKILPILILYLLAAAFLPAPASAQSNPPINILFFYSKDCEHCKTVNQLVLAPLQAQYPQIVLHAFEINDPTGYEGMVRVEEYFKVAPEKRGIPTIVIGDKVLVGEDEASQLPGLVQDVLSAGSPWPSIPSLEALQNTPPAVPQFPLSAATPLGPAGPAAPGSASTAVPAQGGGAACSTSATSSCSTGKTIWAAYFYTSNCESCSIVNNDLNYLRKKYPQLIVQPFDIKNNAGLGLWLAERVGRKHILTPAVFLGTDALFGSEELTPQNLEAMAKKHISAGTERVWDEYDPAIAPLATSYATFGPFSLALAGANLVLGPLALSILILFSAGLSAIQRAAPPAIEEEQSDSETDPDEVSYDDDSGGKMLLAGGLFLLAMFGLLLAAGQFFPQTFSVINTAVPALSAALAVLLAVSLAVFAMLALLALRRPTADGSWFPPRRVWAAVTHFASGEGILFLAIGGLVAGLLAALLVLLVAGPSYQPVVTFVQSIPALSKMAGAYLALYNLIYIIPFVLGLLLVYYAAASESAAALMRRPAAKIITALVFITLAVWLLVTVL
jgi:hypothetical protein